jgi:molybdopterin-containing oxidoreductase family iron-sulfur binding subunit
VRHTTRSSDPGPPAHWKSFEERLRSPGFLETLEREFPGLPSEALDPIGRRRFLTLMGASLGLAGATACTRQPAEHIVPYVQQPESVVPGRPLYYASAMPLDGYARGVLVETHEGRPTKIEGNPAHPASLGATDAFAQASVLDLYDPDRSQTLTHQGEIRPYSAFAAAMRAAIAAQRPRGGAGLRILTGTVTSETLGGQLDALLAELPEARWHVWEPLHRDRSLEGALAAFGRPVETIWRFEAAEIVLTLDADPFAEGPGSVRYARELARRRRPDGERSMSRLYAVESTATLFGAQADHRLLVPPSEVTRIAFALAEHLGVIEGPGLRALGERAAWVGALASDLLAHRGASLVIAGEPQPAAVHALAHAINARLGNHPSTVVQLEPVERRPVSRVESLRELVADMSAGRVDLLLILGGNPVYDAPADLDFAAALASVEQRVHLSPLVDETSELCQWNVPESHYLEAWSDLRAFDGTVSIVQPVIEPLYASRSAHELLAALGDGPVTGHAIVRGHWARRGLDERGWREALHRGVLPATQAPRLDLPVDADRVRRRAAQAVAGEPPDGLSVVFRPDPCIHDGRFANNGWLQELPKPLTKLTWDNAALVSVRTAARLGVGVEMSYRGGERGQALADMVELRHGGRSLEAAVWVVPDQPDDCLTIHLGYGRSRAGRSGTGRGFDAYRLRTAGEPWSAPIEVHRTGRRFALANTQGHWSLEGRDIVRSGSLERYRRDPTLAPPHAHGEPPAETSFYPPHVYAGHAWGMAIDTSVCNGCSACVVACQAENNVPIIGKDQVAAGRAMHWLRIDRYHKGPPEDPAALETYFQPMLCQHCELAPCEPVCPVAATVHSAEGLNDMVYNRCVGTRYCSNNCPYKVRRFNFFLYADWDTPSLKLLRNPDVTVRSRGVMEKCTYCVQRIQAARIRAEIESRPLADGDITTACEAACPTQAIRFGDLNDPESEVARLQAAPRAYGVLAELNTRPRTRYLAAVRNPNPAIRADAPIDPAHGEG